MSVQAYIISYDISDNKERYRVEKTIRDFGFRIQHSVFYAVLDQHHQKKLKSHLNRLNIKTGYIFITSINKNSWDTIGVNPFIPEEDWSFTLL